MSEYDERDAHIEYLKKQVAKRDELLEACDQVLMAHMIGVNCHGPRLPDRYIALFDAWREELKRNENR